MQARLFRLFTRLSKKTKEKEREERSGVSFGDGLAESALQKVIITVLIVLLVFPLLEADESIANPYEIYGLRQLDTISSKFDFNSSVFHDSYDLFTTYEKVILSFIYISASHNCSPILSNHLRNLCRNHIS